jgi:plastocyanin
MWCRPKEKTFFHRVAIQIAGLVTFCALLFGCNIFSMAGILDNPASGGGGPIGGSTQGGTTPPSGDTTLKLVPEAVNIPVNGTRMFTATGGTGGYTYMVETGGVGGTIDATGLYHAPSSPGTDSVMVKDSSGSGCTSTAMVTASGSVAISPSTIGLGAGSTVTFAASGGIPPYIYSVAAGSGTIDSGTGFFIAPPAVETDTVHVVDSVANTADAIVAVASPPALHIVPGTTTVTVGQSINFTGGGGSGNPVNYTYTKVSGGGSLVGATYTAPGFAETATIRLTDTRTFPLQSPVDATVTVNPPAALAISPGAPTLSVGQSVTFTGSGGSNNPANYTYSIFSGSGTLVGATYTAPGSATTAVIRLTDSFTAQPPVDATVTVNSPTALAINPASGDIYDTGSVTFTTSGGSGNPANYSYSMISGSGTLVGATYTPILGVGVGAVIRVTDMLTLQTKDSTITVTVPVGLAISPRTVTIDAGGTVTFSEAGGTSPYNFIKLSGGGTFNGTTLIYTAPWSATTAQIQVTDGASNTDVATVTVNLPSLLISPSTTTCNVGQSVAFTGSGGSGNPANYSYSKTSGSGTLVGATYTAPGSATTAVIRITDALTGQMSNATVTVSAPPSLVISPCAPTCNVGQTVTFTGSGGSGNPANYTYSKISGGGTLVGATYTAPGSATTAVIRLTDSFTAQTSNATVTVNTPAPLTFTPATTNVIAGSAVVFTPGGGSGSYVCSLVSGTGTLVPATYTYTTVVAETSVIRLRDTITGGTADATVVAFFPLTVIPATTSLQINDTYQFSASGGIPPYTYSVTPAGTFNASGLFTAPGSAQTDTVKVSDLISNSSTASVTVHLPGPWNIVSIEASAQTGQYASLALDSSGLPRIAYYESLARELHYAAWNGTSWSTQVVDTSTSTIGQYCSLALEPGTGYPRISYYDAYNHDLRYAAWNGSSWSKQTVASSGDVGKYTSLAIEPGTLYPRIAYYDETYDNLKYATWNGSAWSTQTLDTPGSVGLNTSLVLEPGTNRPRISYYDKTNKRLKYASWNGSAWAYQVVDAPSGGDVGLYSSLAIEPGTNYPHISYYDKTNMRLKYASWNGSAWAFQVVDAPSGGDVGMYNSIALEPGTNYPRISYYDNTNKHLKFASSNGSVWTIEPVDSANQVGSYTSLKLDPSAPHKPRIAYYDASAQDLKYAVKP